MKSGAESAMGWLRAGTGRALLVAVRHTVSEPLLPSPFSKLFQQIFALLSKLLRDPSGLLAWQRVIYTRDVLLAVTKPGPQ